tara:strand:- start:1178 stop:2023 length:846 start_codon:yes stop_codon:yes gene_type:complete
MPTIDFITFNEDSLRDFKPVLAKSMMPDWWKKMKVNQAIRGKFTQTIRACPAMHDWTKSGWYIVSNRDMRVLVGHDREAGKNSTNYLTQDEQNHGYNSPSHPSDQVDNAFEYLGGDNPVRDAFKMRSAWNIKTPPGYSCLYLDPFLHQNKFFSTWHGIIDTDTFNVNYDNAQIIFYPKVEHSFTIPAGTPLVQVIPFKREEWVASYQLGDAKSWHENRSQHTSHGGLPTMDEMGRTKYDDMKKDGKMGAYRLEGYWQEKGQFFKENEPPPECPFHNGDKDD